MTDDQTPHREGQFHHYVSNRIPEISDELYRIDDTVCAKFNWELGPFETWDVYGVEKAIADLEAAGKKPAQWIYDMVAAGATSFYKIEDGAKKYWDVADKAYKTIPGSEGLLVLENLRADNTVWKNSDTTITDLGDGILNLEFHTKMNTIGGGVIAGMKVFKYKQPFRAR